jgi:hypothetical protein
MTTYGEREQGGERGGERERRGRGKAYIGMGHGEDLLAEGVMLGVEPSDLNLWSTQQTTARPISRSSTSSASIHLLEYSLELCDQLFKVKNLSPMAAKDPLGGKDGMAPVATVVEVAQGGVVL